jgi:hypothetical protein
MELKGLTAFYRNYNDWSKLNNKTEAEILKKEEDYSFYIRPYLDLATDINFIKYDDGLSQIQFSFLSFIKLYLINYENTTILDGDLRKYYISMTRYIHMNICDGLSNSISLLEKNENIIQNDFIKIMRSFYIIGMIKFSKINSEHTPQNLNTFLNDINNVRPPFYIKDILDIIENSGSFGKINKVQFYFSGIKKPISLKVTEQLESEIFARINPIQKFVLDFCSQTGWDEKKAKKELKAIIEIAGKVLNKSDGIIQLLIYDTYNFLLSKKVKPIDAGCILYDLAIPLLPELESFENYSSKEMTFNPKSWEWNQFRHKEIVRIGGLKRKFPS